MKKKYLLILTYLFTLTAFSQSINTDRPDQTEGSSTINKGTFQIETGILLSEDDNTNEKSLFLPSTLLRFGITDNIELRIFQEIEHKIYHSNTITGFNDLQLGLKLQLFKKENSGIQLIHTGWFLFRRGVLQWDHQTKMCLLQMFLNQKLFR